jgi:amino acid transporter
MSNVVDDQELIAFGYKPQLHRNLGYLASFTASFSMMSVLMGVFSNYGYVLTKAGAFGIWSWILVGVGQAFVALVFAEMAARIPLTGATYQWNTKLANPMIGWITGWLTVVVCMLAVAGLITAFLTPLQTFLGVTFSTNEASIVCAVVIALLALTNIYGVRFAAHTNQFLVAIEMLALFAVGLTVLGLALAKGETHAALLTTIPTTPTPYLPAFLMSILLGAWTIIGFEIPSELSEETLDIKTVAPKSVVSSVLTTATLGLVFLVILTVAIPDIDVIAASSDPVSAIVTYYLGDTATKIFLLCALTAILGCALVTMMFGSRVVFAMARDRRFIASLFFARVSSQRKTPAMALVLVAIVAALLCIFAPDATSLYAAPTILLSLVYLTTVINAAIGFNKLPPAVGFSLGRWRGAVIAAAIMWLIAMIAILTIPDEFHAAALVAGCVIVTGVVLYPLVGRDKAVQK